jgi:hypothetical protein
MKKIYVTIVLMLVVLASHAQSLNPLIGLWSPSTNTNSAPFTKLTFITIISDSEVKVSLAGNIHAVYNLKPITGGFETVLPIEVKKMYGYDAKRIFLRLYNQNNILRGERKIYEYDRNGTILNSNPTLDNVIYKKVVLKNSPIRPNTSQTIFVALADPNAAILKQSLEDIKNSTNLSNFSSFNINEFNVEVLNKGDNDENGDHLYNKIAFSDMFEITGTIDFVQDNGKLFNLYNNGNNHVKSFQPSYSTFIPLGEPFIIKQFFTYDLNGKGFDISKLRFKVFLNENDLSETGGDSPGKVQLTTNKTFEVFLKDLKYGKNQIVLYSKDGGSLALNFNIKPN